MAQILVVDDSATVRNEVSSFITSNGMTCEVAVDGKDGLEKLKKDPAIKLIISDVNMPNMDGLTLVEELRKLPQYQNAPILMLSTESDPNLKQRGKEVGVTGWILKPINQVTFSSIIDKVVEKYSA